ncbi:MULTISPECIES: hypothetical protein [Alphaproteobacteria]|uniref:hypothetical protein n=1 Tax=Sphingopyxis sp. TaxID=1908224 RepID=UPI00403492C8
MNLLHTLGLMTRKEHERARRESFKAGWRTNSVGEDTHSGYYLDGCEQVDYEEYERLGIALYLGSIQPIDDAPGIDWEAKFKLAATDLAAQAEEIEGLRGDVAAAEKAADELTSKLQQAAAEIATTAAEVRRQDGVIEGMAWEIRHLTETLEPLRPDAQKWRDSLKRSRDRKAARKGSVS